MPSKKKSKPSFQVPEELQNAPQAGWVYRSDGHAPAKEAKAGPKHAAGKKAAAKSKPAKSAPPAHAAHASAHAVSPSAETKAAAAPKANSPSKSSNGIMDLTAKTLSAGFGIAGGLVFLATSLLATPFALGKRMLHL